MRGDLLELAIFRRTTKDTPISPKLTEKADILRLLLEESDRIVEEQVLEIQVERLREGTKLPSKSNDDDSGWDLFAAEDVIVHAGQTVIVPTGLRINYPKGYGATVRPRSGLTSSTKMRVQLGTVDNPYRGELGIIIDNIAPVNPEVHLQSAFYISKGDKIAQLVLERVYPSKIVEVPAVDTDTDRGEGGFGSTGTK